MVPADIYCQWIDNCFEHNRELEKQEKLNGKSEEENEQEGENDESEKKKQKTKNSILKKIKKNKQLKNY